MADALEGTLSVEGETASSELFVGSAIAPEPGAHRPVRLVSHLLTSIVSCLVVVVVVVVVVAMMIIME
jgi:hypothetical protein